MGQSVEKDTLPRSIQVLKPTYRVEECLAEIRTCLECGWTGMGFKTVEFEGNLKNIYLSIDGKQNVRCSISNAVETSGISTTESIDLKFSSSDAVVLPIGPLAVD